MLRRLRSAARSLLEKSLASRDLAIVPAREFVAGSVYLQNAYRQLGIDLVLDVGANNGSTGEELRAGGYAGRIVSFEPQSAVFAELQTAARNDPRWECRRLALSDTTGVASMEVSGASVSSSLLAMSEEHIKIWPQSRPAGREDVPVARLDDLAEELGIANHRALLKIDVQGFELAVLRGAVKTLPFIAAVFAEILFVPLYRGQAKYFDVMALLDAAGFRFAGLFDAHYGGGGSPYPVFANGLFVRSNPPTQASGMAGQDAST